MIKVGGQQLAQLEHDLHHDLSVMFPRRRSAKGSEQRFKSTTCALYQRSRQQDLNLTDKLPHYINNHPFLLYPYIVPGVTAE